MLPHKVQRSILATWVETRRRFVSISSCITTFHVDFCESAKHASWKVDQTRVHWVPGCFLVIGIVAVSLAAPTMSRSTAYKRFLNLCMVSLLFVGVIYAISRT